MPPPTGKARSQQTQEIFFHARRAIRAAVPLPCVAKLIVSVYRLRTSVNNGPVVGLNPRE